MRERARAMLDRVTVEARAAIGDAASGIVRGALAEVLEFRDARIDDDHDPRLLHTARTIRVLIADAACRSVDILAAAAFVDSIDPSLSPPAPVASLRTLIDSVPRPADSHAPDPPDSNLLERLVTAETDIALIAVTERLDHARHIHMRDEVDWRPFHTEIRDVYIPAARRCSAPIARRLERWADAFERKLILPR